MTNYRIDHMINKSKEHLILAEELLKDGYTAQENLLKAISALTGAVDALAIATCKGHLTYNQLEGTVT